MRLTESDAWNILAAAMNAAGISATAAQLDRAAAAFVKSMAACRWKRRAAVAAVAVAVAGLAAGIVYLVY